MRFAAPAPGSAWTPRPGEWPAEVPRVSEAWVPTLPPPDAGPFNLAQLVDTALSISPDTQRSWAEARAAAAAWGSARSRYYPSLDARFSATWASAGATRGLTGFDEGVAESALALRYLLLDFGGRSAGAEAAKQGLLAANWGHNQAIQNVVLDVARAYYLHLGDKSLLAADEVSLSEARSGVQAAEERRRVGTGTLADVLQARAAEAKRRFALAAVVGAVQISRGKLATSVGWPANTPFSTSDEAADPPFERIDENVEALIAEARKHRAELAAAIAAVHRREAELHAAEAAQWPELLGGAGVAEQDVISGTVTSATNYGIGVELKVPLFEGFALENAVRAAKARLDAAKAELRRQEEEVIAQAWNSFFGYQTALQQVQASEALFGSASESYAVTLGRYRAGLGDILELLNAQAALADARADRIRAGTHLLTSYAELVHAIGADLPFSAPRVDSGSVGGTLDRAAK